MKTFGHFLVYHAREIPTGIDPSVRGVGATTGVYGAQVATSNFLKHLLRHGDFDEYHFFVPEAVISRYPSLRTDLFGSLETDHRIKLYRIEDFPRLVAERDYHVFHNPGGPDLTDWLYMRNNLSAQNIPVTGVTHTISYQMMLKDLTLLMLAGPQAWDSIICTSETARNVMETLVEQIGSRIECQCGRPLRYGGRFDTIPLGVDTQAYKPREKAQVRQQLELPMDKLILLWFGRFAHYDKADLIPLLLAFKKALATLPKPSEPQVMLLLAGEDTRHSYSEQVRKCAAQLGIEQNIIIRPNPPLVVGPLYYSASDIFICPSDNIQETFGQTVIEAMSSGLPVICSDWNGFRQTVLHGKTGFRIPTYWADCDSSLCDFAPMSSWRFDHLYLSQATCVDIGLMAEAICLLAGSPDTRGAMAVDSRAHVLQQFDWKIVVTRYLDLWNELYLSAKAHGVTARATQSWLRPTYCHTFQAYPTSKIAAGTCVRTNSAAAWAEDSGKILQHYPELSSIFRLEMAEAILREAGSGATVKQLEGICLKAFNSGPEEVQWHVLRLLKYHYLLLDAASRGAFESLLTKAQAGVK